MNSGNDEVYVYFSDVSGSNSGGLFRASRLLGVRPLSTTTTTIHFEPQTHDATSAGAAVDVVTITHDATVQTGFTKNADGTRTAVTIPAFEVICEGLAEIFTQNPNRTMIVVADDQNRLFAKNLPMKTTTLGTSIAFDA
tara:strand:+ start:6061 stop:6477 length:417 start_codon:yes stop_codon:yes gene_type:complete